MKIYIKRLYTATLVADGYRQELKTSESDLVTYRQTDEQMYRRTDGQTKEWLRQSRVCDENLEGIE